MEVPFRDRALAGANGWKLAGYSNRSASVGFTAEAQRAGISAAPNVAEQKTNVAMTIVDGSVGLMPYSCDSTNRSSA